MIGRDSWLWEITSLVFSAVCVVAMVAVLINRQGTTLAAWHLSIAPNTVISVLATVSKTCLLLPVTASISQLKWLHFNRAHRLSDLDLYDNVSRGPLGALFFVFRLPLSLGALGAIITIVALAFDPFAQQLISFPSRQAATHNETAFFRISQTYESGAYYNNQNNIVDNTDFAMQGAIYNGLFGSPSPRAFTCPTSQCTWPDNSSYILLGAAGECENVTESVVNTCEYPMDSRSADCNITTPGGFHLASKRRHQSSTFQYTLLNSTAGPSRTDADLINFAVWRLIGLNLSEFEVLECRLSLTAFLYRNVSVSQNILNIQDEIPIPLEGVGSPNPGLAWFRPSVGNFPPEVMFALHSADYSKITDVLSEIFNAQAMTPWGEATALMIDVLLASNLSRIVENIAWGMTERIRTGRNSTIASGVAYHPETYIHVNWPWITLPVLVVIGASILLACSIIFNSRHSAALWKSSNLAVLLHSVEGLGDYGHLPSSSNDAPLASIEALADKLRVSRVIIWNLCLNLKIRLKCNWRAFLVFWGWPSSWLLLSLSRMLHAYNRHGSIPREPEKISTDIAT
ncbi:unnamed protein product [Penicillium nalgiovense]|uniref:Uncharacterized protein n=1 Tax=Penicillium nalgiovense TaxID=60175 RepID=A0A9W4MPW6_PENNA|nr:unnamed protein product [Penicillium nalgiovense]CAG7949274.1 unnamed protein product [Penicillium nalgiovense]CAG7975934.1 unnamed protein product [Penicillium nalgiovense]CAG7990189.1 unnamed protein product [Penicillium nalgiovense]CAG8014263.1 unnamed protein product [Penicillium nalgiovense]